jgi:hypothetical protein
LDPVAVVGLSEKRESAFIVFLAERAFLVLYFSYENDINYESSFFVPHSDTNPYTVTRDFFEII